MTDLNLQAALKTGWGVVCRRLAAPQGHEYKSIAVSCILAPVRCCVCRCSYWLSCVLWRYIHASRVDTAPVRAAAICAALAMSVWLYIVRCAVMCDIDCHRTCPAPFPMLAAHKATVDTAL